MEQWLRVDTVERKTLVEMIEHPFLQSCKALADDRKNKEFSSLGEGGFTAESILELNGPPPAAATTKHSSGDESHREEREVEKNE